jgi:hypothetical protein
MDKKQVEELVACMRRIRESLLPRIARSTGNGKRHNSVG